jgi:hypothetical protein
VADQDGDSLQAGDQGSELALAGGKKVIAQQQVFGRIAAERQFRRQQQIGALFARTLAKSRIRARLPAKSPTVALIWAIAIFRGMGSVTSEKGRSCAPRSA